MRILNITYRVPYPVISGASLRTYNLLRRVAEAHEVWLGAFVSTPEQAEGVSHLQEFCCGVETTNYQELGALARPVDLLRYPLTGKPLELRLQHSEELASKLRSLTEKIDFDLVQIEHSFMALYLETLPPQIRNKTVLMLHDVVYKKYERIYRLEPKPARKLRLWLHSHMMRWWEPRYSARFARCITLSEADRHLLTTANPQLQVDVVPNGVDIQTHQPLPYPEDTKPVLIFVGSMDYRPNIDAMLYFCKDILPHIRQAIADVEMWIVGANPVPAVRQLAGDGVHVTGRVEDVRPYYRQSAACLVPLRGGGGTRLKILEAMALGRPVVSTPIGCEGLQVVDGEHILIAASAEAFAEQTVRLLTDMALWRRIAIKARQLAETYYDWDVIAKRLLQIYAAVVA